MLTPEELRGFANVFFKIIKQKSHPVGTAFYNIITVRTKFFP
jgi:hypothetical protein